MEWLQLFLRSFIYVCTGYLVAQASLLAHSTVSTQIQDEHNFKISSQLRVVWDPGQNRAAAMRT